MDDLTITINGSVYSGWTEIRVTRSLQQCAADFDLMVTERWAGAAQGAWQIAPFDQCVIAIGGDKVLTGYIDKYMPSYDATSHNVRIAGRSKTCDIVDCMPDITGGQFNGQKVDAIARAVCAPFGITVMVEDDPGEALPDATLEKAETAHSFLDRLARLRALLICDDENGNLVLTTAGASASSAALVEGDNIKAASATLSGHERFSDYVVLAQTPLAYDESDVRLDIEGSASDSGVPRFRRHAEMAEGPADNALAAERARWRALYNFGRSTEVSLTVQGWRQPDGSLWKINQLIPVKSPMLALDRVLLVTKVGFALDESGGRRTELALAPQEAFTPDPASVKLKKTRASAAIWNQAVSID